jgi:4-azaleucine resistance transporter AzlC
MRQRPFLLGIQKTLPLMIGVVPFGLAYGITAVQSGISPAEAFLMSALVFAGASQFLALGLLGQGAGYLLIILSTLLINLRHLLMGLSLSPYLKKQRSGRLCLLAFGMVDECYATTISHYQAAGQEDGDPWFMLGSGAGLYLAWLASSAAGCRLAASISDPLAWGLDFAMPVTFLTMLIPQIGSARMLAVALASGLSAVAFYLLIPGKWYIILAALLATVLGAVLESHAERRCAPSCA